MPRRRIVTLVAALLVAAGLWYLLPHPWTSTSTASAALQAWPDPEVAGSTPDIATSPSTTGAATSATSGASAPSTQAPEAARRKSSPTTASVAAGPRPAESCRVGEPQRLRIPALGVDAPFERIGLDPNGRRDSTGQAPLGTPTDRTKAGWYAAGPEPGSGTGTVLIDGHTYRNGSAIFKDDFAARIATGQLIQLRQDNGSVCTYRVTDVWRAISSAHAYPALIASQHLYDFTGPERLLLATCGGTWDPAIDNYDDINVVLAVPVTRR